MMGAETRAQVRALAVLYRRGRVDAAGLKNAVDDGTITAAEYKAITGTEYGEAV